MKNNYDLILNFETKDGEPLSEETIEKMLNHAEYMAVVLGGYNNIKIWKAIIAQGVDSRKFVVR